MKSSEAFIASILGVLISSLSEISFRGLTKGIYVLSENSKETKRLELADL